jgi:hypothetical protein
MKCYFFFLDIFYSSIIIATFIFFIIKLFEEI